MHDVLAAILGGGRGTRLFLLTLHRSKPAVPIGGKYRLIDIPIGNCLNSGIRRIFVLILPFAAALAHGQGVAIDHKQVDCIVAGEHPRLNACFQPASGVAKRRVYFRPEGVESWSFVEMTGNAACHEGILPKPKKQLLGKHVYYYVAQEAGDGSVVRTDEYDPVVARAARECKTGAAVASLPNAPVVVFPATPSGFVGAAGISPLVVGAAALAAGAGVANAATTANDAPPARGTTPPSPPTPTPPPPASPVPPPPPPATPPLALACTANPRSGEAPLRVAFRAFPTGGTGVYDYLWRFGDGATSTQVTPAHTYAAGDYLASVELTSGTEVARCERSISVTPGGFILTVLLGGTRFGIVLSNPAGIACGPAPPGPPAPVGGDCTEAYPDGTVVTLTAFGTEPDDLGGWSGGGCSGTGACVVTMDADQTVTAVFYRPSFLLTVNLAGAGTGTVTSSPAGIDCPGDCTETYPFFTSVSLTATPTAGSSFAGWTGAACSGIGNCTVLMAGPTMVTATFAVSSVQPARPQGRLGLRWHSQLAARGATGHVLLNGGAAGAVREGRAELAGSGRGGINHVEAVLTEAKEGGAWRFEIAEGQEIEAYSLIPLLGEVVLATPQAIVFRLKGQIGERVAFRFRMRTRN